MSSGNLLKPRRIRLTARRRVLGLMHSQQAAHHHHLQLEQTLESFLWPRGLICFCGHKVVPAPPFPWCQALGSTKGWSCLTSWGVRAAAGATTKFWSKQSKCCRDYHALSKEYGGKKDITVLGTRETELSCPVCLPNSSALIDRKVWAFQHRHLCPARIWHWAWKGKLLVLSWKLITAG